MTGTTRPHADESRRLAHPTSVHYDQELEFFRCFLDPYLKYTSGLYASPTDSNDRAMVRMLDKHLELAELTPTASVLDIGCGWGSLLRRLRETHPRVKYTGLAPSENQLRYIRENLDANAGLILGSFEDTSQPRATYDAIILSGALCHLRDKRTQLARIAALLKPGGSLVIEDTFFLSEELYRKHGGHPKTRFVQQDIFGYAEIRPLGEHVEMAASAGLRVTYCEENSESYRRTINGWIAKLRDLEPTVFPLASDYIRYLSIAQEGWNYTIANYVMALKASKISPLR